MNIKSLFTNRLATQTFLILLLGFILIHLSALFIYNAYWHLDRKRLSPNRLAGEVIKVVALSKSLSPEQFKMVLRDIRHPGVHIKFEKRKVNGLTPLLTYDPKQIRKKIIASPDKFRFDYPLSKDTWISIRTKIYKPKWLLFQLFITALIVFFATLLLILWAINRLVLPIDRINFAVKRLATDIQAPPLSETGPKPLRELSRAFNRMQTQLQSLINNRTQMLAAISHDLRTPITRLKLRAESIEDPKQADKFDHDLTEMDQMIRSILIFSKDQVYNEPVEDLDLEALLTSLCDDLTDTGYKVTYQGYGKRLIIRGRLLPLKRAFNNLIENAVRYGKQANVKLTTNEDTIIIRITDEGPGIPEEELDKVFLPFYRADKSRSPQQPGTGLGLAITQDIIKAHGGEITLRNIKPVGLAATITLPC